MTRSRLLFAVLSAVALAGVATVVLVTTSPATTKTINVARVGPTTTTTTTITLPPTTTPPIAPPTTQPPPPVVITRPPIRVQAPPPPTAAAPPPPTTAPVPFQNDNDADNFGGPSDGDGNK